MEYIAHLKKDPLLRPLIKTHGVFELKPQKNLAIYLCYSIISQQLSTKVASVFKQRFNNLFEDGKPTSALIINIPFETLRSIGLSNAKAQYILNVAAFDLSNGIQYGKLNKMTNEAVIAYLTQIKGVGKWTVEMMLMFALCREDVFPIDDLGIRNAIIKLYNIRHRDKKLITKKIITISKQWTPFSTYACMYLWRSLDAPN